MSLLRINVNYRDLPALWSTCKCTELNFRHLSIDEGLSQNAVFTILQDSRRFMWLGVSVQFVRGISAKSYNPEEERGAGNRRGLSFTNEIIKAHRANSLQKPKNN